MDILISLAGGALALIGGFVASYVLEKIRRRDETRAAIRSKLEELSFLIGEIQSETRESFNQIVAMIQGHPPEKVRLPSEDDAKVRRLDTIAALYLPALGPSIQDFHSARKAYTGKFRRIIVSQAAVRKEDKASNDELQVLIRECNDILMNQLPKSVDSVLSDARRYLRTHLLDL